MDYERLTSAELIGKLQEEERARGAIQARLAEAEGRERLLRELEAQNESLRRAQREIEASRNRYVDLYDFAPIPYCTFDRSGVVREINLLGAMMLGKDRALIIGYPFLALARVNDSSAFAKHVRECLEFRGPIAGEVTLSAGRGEREFQLLSTAVRDASGAATACRTAFLDVTERRRAERRAHAAHESERAAHDRLTSAIECFDDALALFDADEQLVLCNNAYRKLIGGLVSGSLIGKLYGEILDSWLQEVVFASEDERSRIVAERVAERHGSRRFELRTHDGRSLRVMNRRTVEGGIVQTIWDLTDDVERERELREAREAAEAASAAKSDFLSSMSREVRTPLNAILGFAQLLQRDEKTPLQERHRTRVTHILKGGEHLVALIDEVLELSRIETGRVAIALEPVSLAGVLAEVQSTLTPMAQRMEVELILDPVPLEMTAIADQTRFKQILMNYGSNAIKYGRKCGKVTFQTSCSDAVVRVLVSDDGTGIPLGKQDKIFEPFRRAGQESGPIEGAGLGLAITKRLAELMHGRVGFRSVEGRGSEFWVELPAPGAAGTAL